MLVIVLLFPFYFPKLRLFSQLYTIKKAFSSYFRKFKKVYAAKCLSLQFYKYLSKLSNQFMLVLCKIAKPVV